MKNSLVLLSGLLTILGFGYFAGVILFKDVPLNPATWWLWVVIDVSLLISTIKAGNKRPWMMIAFAVGATTIALMSLAKLIAGTSSFAWGHTETLAAVCASIALMAWKYTSNNGGVVAITLAMYIAMIPTLIQGWQQPVGQDPLFWGAGAVACLLAFIGGEKNIAERFMPAFGTFFNGLMTVFALRQFFM